MISRDNENKKDEFLSEFTDILCTQWKQIDLNNFRNLIPYITGPTNTKMQLLKEIQRQISLTDLVVMNNRKQQCETV